MEKLRIATNCLIHMGAGVDNTKLGLRGDGDCPTVGTGQCG